MSAQFGNVAAGNSGAMPRVWTLQIRHCTSPD